MTWPIVWDKPSATSLQVLGWTCSCNLLHLDHIIYLMINWLRYGKKPTAIQPFNSKKVNSMQALSKEVNVFAPQTKTIMWVYNFPYMFSLCWLPLPAVRGNTLQQWWSWVSPGGCSVKWNILITNHCLMFVGSLTDINYAQQTSTAKVFQSSNIDYSVKEPGARQLYVEQSILVIVLHKVTLCCPRTIQDWLLAPLLFSSTVSVLRQACFQHSDLL